MLKNAILLWLQFAILQLDKQRNSFIIPMNNYCDTSNHSKQQGSQECASKYTESLIFQDDDFELEDFDKSEFVLDEEDDDVAECTNRSTDFFQIPEPLTDRSRLENGFKKDVEWRTKFDEEDDDITDDDDDYLVARQLILFGMFQIQPIRFSYFTKLFLQYTWMYTGIFCISFSNLFCRWWKRRRCRSNFRWRKWDC